MIDWITVVVKVDTLPVMGTRIETDKDGEIKRVLKLPEHIPSSSTTIFCVTIGDDLLISGNPTKFYQTHNILSVDHWGLVDDFLYDVCFLMGCNFIDIVKVTRLDLTHSLVMTSYTDVEAMLSELRLITAEHWGRPVSKGGTVYFGHRKRFQLKFYEKSQEIKRGKYRIDIDIPILRIELTIGRDHLRENGWRQYQNQDIRLSEYSKMVDRLRINELDTVDLSSMPRKLQKIFGLWKAGVDIRQIYSIGTLYNYASELREYKIDIWQPYHVSNVVQFRRALQSRPLVVQDVINMGLQLYSPRSLCAA